MLLAGDSLWRFAMTSPVRSSLIPMLWRRPVSTSATDDVAPPESVAMHLLHGLPRVTVPLPSRNEPCVFTLKPVTHTVGDFTSMIRAEDAGIDRAVVRTGEGIRVASTTSIQTLLREDFQLIINDKIFDVQPAKEVIKGRLSDEELDRLGEIRNIVGQLYESLNVEEHQALQEKRLLQQLERMKQELIPMEAKREELFEMADKKTNYLSWLGLGLMSVQFGILARLTWWEYSWDIMEPVTYFVTYGTAMACYAYFVVTKKEYIFPDARDRQFLLLFHKKAKKDMWDVYKYNALKDSIARLENDLNRLRDPLRPGNPRAVKSKASDGILGSQISIDSLKGMLKERIS